LLGLGMKDSVFVIENDLNQAGAVAQVNKYQSSVVAAAVHPPRQLYFLAGIFYPYFPAIMRALHGIDYNTSEEGYAIKRELLIDYTD